VRSCTLQSAASTEYLQITARDRSRLAVDSGAVPCRTCQNAGCRYVINARAGATGEKRRTPERGLEGADKRRSAPGGFRHIQGDQSMRQGPGGVSTDVHDQVTVIHDSWHEGRLEVGQRHPRKSAKKHFFETKACRKKSAPLDCPPSLGSSLLSVPGKRTRQHTRLSAVARSADSVWRDHGRIASFLVGRRRMCHGSSASDHGVPMFLPAVPPRPIARYAPACGGAA